MSDFCFFFSKIPYFIDLEIFSTKSEIIAADEWASFEKWEIYFLYISIDC